MKPNLDPSERELRWFGLLALLFFAVVAALVELRSARMAASAIILGAGVTLALVYYFVPPLRLPIYRGWMLAVWPIGWLVTHLLLAIAFYLVVTPVGLLLKLLGRDPLERRFDPEATSYWRKRERDAEPSDYFRQF